MKSFSTWKTLIIFALSALFSTTLAQPHLQRRGIPGAYYTCTGSNFKGNCAWTAPTTRCRQQGGNGIGILSLGPDPGGFCNLYEKSDCSGTAIQAINFPGISSNMPQFGGFKCFSSGKRDASTNVPSTKKVNPLADPRLSGGVGSADRLEHLAEIKEMENDGFRQGLIGWRKHVYY